MTASGLDETGYPPSAKHSFEWAAGNKTEGIFGALLRSRSRKNLWREKEKA